MRVTAGASRTIPPRDSLARVRADVVGCDRCPRLRHYCAAVAAAKRRAFRDQPYWGRPVPGFGDPEARLLVVGLAPAAHGGNRTGRVFTGDASGDFLYGGLHRAGFANQPTSVTRNDGLRLTDAYVAAAARCAPPENRPLPVELERCQDFLLRELRLLRRLQAVLCLGRVALDAFVGTLIASGRIESRSGVRFVHGAEYDLASGLARLFVSYHPSRRNTQTGLFTPAMLDRVLGSIRRFVERG
jgi:uracil-DNA glycosylase family 4